jgi:hypothetical protein
VQCGSLVFQSSFNGLEKLCFFCEISTMSKTVILKAGPIAVPEDVSHAAGLRPGDQVDWRFQDGEIRGRRICNNGRLPRIVRSLVVKDGELVLDTEGLTIDPADIAVAVREERDSG